MTAYIAETLTGLLTIVAAFFICIRNRVSKR
ncbi:Uncharacterised protein [Citrobacter amalonaticus]|nr:Uncharacterised protein [Citrobacter amalonaticus]